MLNTAVTIAVLLALAALVIAIVCLKGRSKGRKSMHEQWKALQAQAGRLQDIEKGNRRRKILGLEI